VVLVLLLVRPYNPFGSADKSVEKYCWLICCERKNTVPAEKTS
jgi:hypothetical protein